MADRWWNVPAGGGMKSDVTEGASDTAGYVAVRCTYDATGNSKRATLDALEAVKQYILTDNWAPV